MAFIVDITTKTRVPGESCDVFGRYCNDDPILLGTVYFRRKEEKGDQWVPYRVGGTHPATWAPTKWKAVQALSAELLDHFDDVEARYGKKAWRWKKIEGWQEPA